MKNQSRQPGEWHLRSLALTTVIPLGLVFGLLIFRQQHRELPPAGGKFSDNQPEPLSRASVRAGNGPVNPAAPYRKTATTNADQQIIHPSSTTQNITIVEESDIAPAVLLPAPRAKQVARDTAVSPTNRIRVKLGTIAPVGTSFEKTLKAMSEAWHKDSGGAVNLVIYAGGKLGGEAEMVGLMKADALQAAMLTSVGLSEIDPNVTGLQNIPMGFHDLAAVDYVGQKLQPMLEARLEAKGFVVLFWSDAGWVRFFSNKPVVHPADLKKLRLFTWAGNPAQVEIYKSAGFDPVPRETADIVPGLQTGLIDAVPLPPFFALASQIDTSAPYMLELNWAPLVGALVIRKQTWEKMPAAAREALRKTAATAGREIKAAGRKESEESVTAMEKRGLKVTKVTPETEAEWRQAAESFYPRIRGALVPADVFDEVLRSIKEFRSATIRHATSKPESSRGQGR